MFNDDDLVIAFTFLQRYIQQSEETQRHLSRGALLQSRLKSMIGKETVSETADKILTVARGFTNDGLTKDVYA